MKDSHGTKKERITAWVIGFTIAMAVIWMFIDTTSLNSFRKLLQMFLDQG